jgi:outer membrane immunogenic protein
MVDRSEAGITRASGSFSDTRGGWTLGGGVETALIGNWSAKLEYLYVDLGTTTNSFLSPGGVTRFVETVNTHGRHCGALGANTALASAPTVKTITMD